MEKALINRIKRLAKGYCLAACELNRKYGLHGRDFEILEIISARKNCNQVFIAKELNISKATIGVFLIRLEKKNLITRTVAPLDTRSRNVELTEEGKFVLSELKNAYNKLYDAMFANKRALEDVLNDMEWALGRKAS